jgi:hypothetical protein
VAADAACDLAATGRTAFGRHAVDVVSVIGTIARERGNRTIDPVE